MLEEILMPLAAEPRILERQTNMLRGQLLRMIGIFAGQAQFAILQRFNRIAHGSRFA
jgi:hypothetical protein